MIRIIYNTATGEFLGGPTDRSLEAGEGEALILPSELVHGNDRAFYEIIDGYFTPKDQGDVDAIIAQREADATAEVARLDEIEVAQGSSGIKQYTIDQANTYLDNRFAAMTDLDSVKTELRAILDKMVPYLMG